MLCVVWIAVTNLFHVIMCDLKIETWPSGHFTGSINSCFLILDNSHQLLIPWYLLEHTGRDDLEYRKFRLRANEVHFWGPFSGFARQAQLPGPTSQMAAGGRCGGVAVSAWPLGS